MSFTPPSSQSRPDRPHPSLDPGHQPEVGGRRAGDGPPSGTNRRGRGRVFKTLVIASLICTVVIAGITAWGLRRFNDIAFVDVPGVEPPADGGPANWLLIGTDGREGIDPDAPDAGAFLGEQVVGKRTDTIMLVRVDPNRQEVDLLSIPRDLWVPIAGRDESGRINGAYNGEDGRQRLVATLAGALGVDIHHYAEVNFVGFAEIVDSLDGVPIWFEYPARDVGSGLNIVEPGCHILDGSQALAFARARTFEELRDGEWRLEPTGDLGRTARQRYFLSRVIDTATDKIGVSQVGKVNEILAVGGKNLVVEDGATVGDMVSLARIFSSLQSEQISGHALPVTDHQTSGGAQVLQLQETEAQAVLDRFRDGVPAAPVTDGLSDEQSTGAAISVAVDEWPEGQPGDPNVEVSAIRSVDPDHVGYGRFGFTPSPAVDGTPCD